MCNWSRKKNLKPKKSKGGGGQIDFPLMPSRVNGAMNQEEKLIANIP